MKNGLVLISLWLFVASGFSTGEVQLNKDIKVAPVGKTMQTPEKLEITLHAVRLAPSHGKISFIKPRREIFIEAELTITNKGKSEIKIDSINNFALMDLQGNMMNGEFMLGGISQPLAPKESLTSTIYFDASKASGYYLLFRGSNKPSNAFRINSTDILEVEAL